MLYGTIHLGMCSARRLALLSALLTLLLGCQSVPSSFGHVIVEVATPTPEGPTSGSAPSATPNPSVGATQMRPATAAPTATATPTPTPRATATATATLIATASPTPTQVVPVATLTATQVAQQQYCEVAAPPNRLPLPFGGSSIRISAPIVPFKPALSPGGPRFGGTDPAPSVTARAVAILDEGSGNLMYEKDGFLRVAPASITKILTTIVAIEQQPDLSARYPTTVSASAMVACDGSSVMGLEPGDNVKLETLLYGMMLPSGNDAAEQVAVILGGTRERFVALMNARVQALGLSDTHFVNPSGMDADEHYTSAYDIAVIARYAMQNPAFRTIAATPFIISDDYFMRNFNPLIATYAGADGVKIGFTDIADRTIVASASRDGHRVFVAALGSRNTHGDSIALFEWVWRSFQW